MLIIDLVEGAEEQQDRLSSALKAAEGRLVIVTWDDPRLR